MSQPTPRKTTTTNVVNTNGTPTGWTPVAATVHVPSVRQAAQWYQQLGFEVESKAPGANGDWARATLSFGNGRLCIVGASKTANGSTANGSKTTGKTTTPTTSVTLYVSDVDGYFGALAKIGAKTNGPITDQPWGDRSFTATDPFGVYWTIATHVRDVTDHEMVEDLVDGH